VNPLSSFYAFIYRNIRNRCLNKFWKPFLKDRDISIVLTEYPIIEKKATDASLISRMAGLVKNFKIAEKVSDGYLVSKGNAKALSNVTMYLSKYVAKTKKILVDGNNYPYHYKDLVILGSPINNDYAHRIFSALKERYYEIPFEIKRDEETGVKIVYNKEKNLKPTINNEGTGHDYAVIINAEYEDDRNVVILAGAYMYGIEAASNAVTNEKFLKQIINAKKEIDINNCIFLVKTEVVKHFPKEPTLEKISDNNYYIFPLRKKLK